MCRARSESPQSSHAQRAWPGPCHSQRTRPPHLSQACPAKRSQREQISARDPATAAPSTGPYSGPANLSTGTTSTCRISPPQAAHAPLVMMRRPNRPGQGLLVQVSRTRSRSARARSWCQLEDYRGTPADRGCRRLRRRTDMSPPMNLYGVSQTPAGRKPRLYSGRRGASYGGCRDSTAGEGHPGPQ
jgi:hypothetical protein